MSADLASIEQEITRRHLFQDIAGGMGGVALATMLSQQAAAAPKVTNLLAPKKPHFPARAKNVIFMHMVGGPSQLDLFENKPELVKNHGKDVPQRFI